MGGGDECVCVWGGVCVIDVLPVGRGKPRRGSSRSLKPAPLPSLHMSPRERRLLCRIMSLTAAMTKRTCTVSVAHVKWA